MVLAGCVEEPSTYASRGAGRTARRPTMRRTEERGKVFVMCIRRSPSTRYTTRFAGTSPAPLPVRPTLSTSGAFATSAESLPLPPNLPLSCCKSDPGPLGAAAGVGAGVAANARPSTTWRLIASCRAASSSIETAVARSASEGRATSEKSSCLTAEME